MLLSMKVVRSLEQELTKEKDFIMSEVILFTSGKGGVGKTAITANIGASLAAKGKKTCIIDMNQGLRGQDIVLGLGNLVIYNLVDALNGKCKLNQVLVKDPKRERLSLLPPSQIKSHSDLNAEKLKEAIETVAKHFDYVLIDGCSGMDLGFEHSALAYDRCVIICTGDVLSVRSADKVKEVLGRRGTRPMQIILNRFQADLCAAGDQMSKEETEDILGLDMLGVIPEDRELYVCSNKGETMTDMETPAAKALARITDRILGENIMIPEFQAESKTRSGFWSFFRRG